MKIGDYILLEEKDGTKYLVNICTITDEVVRGEYQLVGSNQRYGIGLWFWSQINSVKVTEDRFKEPKTTLSNLVGGNKFTIVERDSPDDVFTYINDYVGMCNYTHVYSLNNRLYGTNDDLEVTLIKE